ncbi:MAG: hypothetical protein ACTSSE_01040 [Candidatus Thorarchaeota archaeon]
MADDISPMNYQEDTISHQLLFWLTLTAGGISGAANYFILRFTHVLPWYMLAPILFIVSIVFIYIITCSNRKDRSECPFRPYLKFSGTWIITYFVVGTAIFYFGW